MRKVLKPWPRRRSTIGSSSLGGSLDVSNEQKRALPATAEEHPHKTCIRVGTAAPSGWSAAFARCGLVFGLGGMAATIDFSSAVVTGGRLVVSSNVKKIQHRDGGTVVEINVKDGDHVKAGDLLVKLDPTMAAANLGIVTKGLDEELARKARLAGGAERRRRRLTFPDELTARAAIPEVAETMSIEADAFELRARRPRGPEGSAAQEDLRARAAARRHQGAGRRGSAARSR